MWILALITLGVVASQAGQISAKADNSGKVVCERVFKPVNLDKTCASPAPARVDFAQTLPGLTTTMNAQGILQSQSNAAVMQAKKHADSHIRRATQSRRYIVMTVELPEVATEVSSGRLTKALTRSGSDLLLETDQDRQILSPKLLEDNKTVEFEVILRNPERKTRHLKQVTGTLEYSVAGISKQIDSGPLDFRAGAGSGLSGMAINSIKPAESEKDHTTVGLQLNVPYETIKTTKFYDQNGKELEVSPGDWESIGGKTTAYFSITGKLPPKGRIVLEVSEGPQKKTYAFDLSNVPFKTRSKTRRTDQPSGASLRDMLRETGESSAKGAARRQVERTTQPGTGTLEPEADYSTPVPTQLREAASKKMQGDLDGAIRIYTQVTLNDEASDKHVARAYQCLGMCYLKKGDKKMAAEQFRQIVSEFPFLRKEAARASRMLSKIKPSENQRRSRRNARNRASGSRRSSRYSRRNSRYAPSSSRSRRSSTTR